MDLERRTLRWAGLGFLAALALMPLCSAPVYAAEDATAAKAKSQHAAKDAAKSGERTAKEDATHVVSTSAAYVGIDPIYTTIFTGDRITGTLMLGIGLDVEDKALRDKVILMLPVLRDLYVRTMLAYAGSTVRPWRKPDPDAIASRLQLVTDRKLKVKGAKILMAQLAIRLTE